MKAIKIKNTTFNPPGGKICCVVIPHSKVETKFKLQKEKYFIVPSHCEHVPDLELSTI